MAGNAEFAMVGSCNEQIGRKFLWSVKKVDSGVGRASIFQWLSLGSYMNVSENSGTPKSCILIGFSIVNHLFWGTSIFGNTHTWSDQKRQLIGSCPPDSCTVEAVEVVNKNCGSGQVVIQGYNMLHHQWYPINNSTSPGELHILTI